ncbi:MAG: carboxylesterase/lipase family protein [Acidobacteriota bacterium]|nr:MAG: carboxylesterase/lipase family protein [Acidobacteriota bacterium]
MHRRDFLAGAAALAAAKWLGSRQARGADFFPVVETEHGRVRGLTSGGIAVFKGLRYGADTSGRNRFMPPAPVPRWTGVRDALDYGDVSPQIPADRRRSYADLIFFDLQPGGMGEDCLVMNLWTPEPKPGGKRPVIVRFHGGGFYGGSSNSPGADGEMLARFGDCVVITVNHRLGALGYLYLGEDGDFADSGSVGMQDLVALLTWVSRNVEAFGGDPGRVLIFGQSGGGAKVSHLMAMPSAQRLFHSAGVMSGSRLTAMSRQAAAEASDRLLKKLGLTLKEIRKLQELPFSTLLEAQAEVEAAERSRGEAPRSFAPVMGKTIPRHPFDPDAPPISAKCPMVVSTVLDERSYRESNFDMTWDAVKQVLIRLTGADADKVLAMYRNEDSKATPFIINARIITDMSFRRSAYAMADRKAAQHAAGGAPVWSYLWTTPSPAFGGRYGATHGIDVSASMHETRFPLTGPSAGSLRLADQLASAWVSLAATGNPNNPRTPEWPVYDVKNRTAMVFGDPSNAVNDPRRAFREYWAGRASAAASRDPG